MTPSNWNRVPFGEICLSSQYGLSLISDPAGDTSIIGMKDMNDGTVTKRKWARVSIDADERSRYLLNEGDLLLNRTNSPDLVGKVSRWDRPEKAVFASYLVRFVVDPSKADSKFLNYHLNSEYGQAILKSIATRGVSQANINPTVFREAYEVLLPPLDEQRRIATLLSDWDCAIAVSEELALARRSQAEAHRKMLVRGDRRRLTDIALISFSGVDKRLNTTETQVSLCNYMHIWRNHRLTSDINYDRGSADHREIDRFSLKEGDFIFTKDSETAEDIAEVAYVAETMPNVVCGYHLAVGKPKAGNDGAYIAHAMRLPAVRNEFAKRANGAVRFGLTLEALNHVTIPMVDGPRQRQVVDLLDAADAEVKLERVRVSLLRRQKRGLMHKLLTGEWRVPESIDQLMPGGEAAAALAREASAA